MIDAVVFDIGNVLIEWQPERHYDRVIGEARRREMFAAVDLHAMNDGVDRGEQYAGAGHDAPVQCQLPHSDEVRQLFGIGHAHCGQQRESNRQIVMAAFLGQISGREIHGNPLGRQREAHRSQRRLHPLPAFAHRLVRQADDGKARQAGRDLALHLHLARFQPQIGDCPDQCDHVQYPLFVPALS